MIIIILFMEIILPALIYSTLIVLYCGIKCLKKNTKTKKDKNIISTMLPITTTITSICTFSISFIMNLESLSIAFHLFFLILILSLSIKKNENAGNFGIIHGGLSCLSIIGIPVGLLEIIMAYIYLKVFQKKTNINTEYGQKVIVIYDKSFSEDDDEENIV